MSEEDTSGEDDWFERALREDEDETERSPDETERSSDEESPTGETDADDGSWAEDIDTSGGSWAEDVDSSETASSTDASGDAFDETGDSDAFDETGDSDAFDETGDSDAFDETGDSDAFGGGEGSGSLFDDEDFASAFEGAGGDSEFDDEELDSDIDRIDLGIEGLDNMIQGGVPQRHLMVCIGSAGTGKTTFGLQFLHHGLVHGESSVFITLEQSREEIIATADERGWEFAEYEQQGSLAVVDLDPVEMANSLDNIQAELPTLIRDFGADRLVLDSVSLLEMMYDDQARRRTEVFDFTRALKKAGVTTFLTSEASESNPYASRHGIIEYLTDAVFILQYVRGESQETRLAVEIQKIRNANHSREMKPYEMTDEGISVYQQANIF
jgi:circadian clock protein KaiC